MKPHLPLAAAFAVALAAALALPALMPMEALAAQAGPFEVEGPAGSYSYSSGTLTITGEGVTIAGMAAPPVAGENNVHVAKGTTVVTIGSDVHIGMLRDEGTGNTVNVWNASVETGITGSGSIAIGQAPRGDVNIRQATVEIVDNAHLVHVFSPGTLIFGPQAHSLDLLTIFGGTLDLSQVSPDRPLAIDGYSLGAANFPTRIIVPFGTQQLSDLIKAQNAFISVSGIPVFSDGEEVGVLLTDGTIYYTATRTVTFLGWNGQVLAEEQVRLFQPATAPADPDAPAGYEFAGWSQDFSRVTQNMTVAAVFEPLPAPEQRPEFLPAPGQPETPTAEAAKAAKAAAPARKASTRLAATTDAAPYEPWEIIATVAAAAVAGSALAALVAITGRRR